MRSIIKNHPFVDGNKRIGVSVTALFLFMNGRVLFVPPDHLVDYALQIAQPESSLDWKDISAWLKVRCPYVRDVVLHGRPRNPQSLPLVYEHLNYPELADFLASAYEELERS